MDIAITIFCRYLNQWINGQRATMHFEHQTPDKVYIDVAGKKLQWVGPQREVHDAEVTWHYWATVS